MFDKKDSNPLTETLNRVAKEIAMEQEKAAAQATEQNEKMWFDVNLESPRVNAPIVNMGEKIGPAMDCVQVGYGAPTPNQLKQNSSAASQINSAKLFRNIDQLVDTAFKEDVIASERCNKLIRLQRLAGNNPEIVELIELMKELGY